MTLPLLLPLARSSSRDGSWNSACCAPSARGTLWTPSLSPIPPSDLFPSSPDHRSPRHSVFRRNMGMGAGMGGGGHANNPTFMFQARCGPRVPRQLRGARRIARRTAKKLRGASGDLSAPALAPHPRRPLAAAPASPRPGARRAGGLEQEQVEGRRLRARRHRPRLLHPVQVRARRRRALRRRRRRPHPPPHRRSPTRPPPLLRAMDFAQKKAGVEW